MQAVDVLRAAGYAEKLLDKHYPPVKPKELSSSYKEDRRSGTRLEQRVAYAKFLCDQIKGAINGGSEASWERAIWLLGWVQHDLYDLDLISLSEIMNTNYPPIASWA